MQYGEYDFHSCWVDHTFWLLENIWEKVLGIPLDHYYFNEIFLPTILGSKTLAEQFAEQFLEGFQFAKYGDEESNGRDVLFNRLFHSIDYSSHYVDISLAPSAGVIHPRYNAILQIDSAA